eukprot:14817745-Alexandrium_andersonii.AAC.1
MSASQLPAPRARAAPCCCTGPSPPAARARASLEDALAELGRLERRGEELRASHAQVLPRRGQRVNARSLPTCPSVRG